MQLRRFIAVAGVVMALLLACAQVDGSGPRAIDEDDICAAVDDGLALEAGSASPVLVPPVPRRRAAIEHRVPVSRAAVADVFRPPQARA